MFLTILVYIMDDILAALDAHVAKHVVQYCILGLLKNKTRLIVTENQTLFFHANQILRVDGGHIGPSDVNSNSFDADIELQITSDFEVPKIELSDDGKRSVDSLLMEESKEHGTLAPRVFRAYWMAMGGWIGVLTLLSVLLMQITRNFSDAWLAYWIADINPAKMAIVTDNRDMLKNMSSFVVNTTLEKVAENVVHLATGNITDISDPIPNPSNFYVLVYAVIALTNSVVTLGRAFIFAYAGIKAAKFIHTELLSKVFYVS